MSRKRQEEDHFGSDSFLDVLANIVGILIILIVSAAARVQRGSDPVPAPVVAATEESPPVLLPTPTVVEAEPDPSAFTAEKQALQQKLADLDGKSHAVVSRLRSLEQELAAARSDLGSAELQAQKQDGRLKKQQLQLARLEEAIGERQGVLRGLLAEFEEVENSQAPATEVKHRLAPVSQEVMGKEVYFRISGGRVSVVPIELLAERMKNQIERQKEWLAARGQHEAVVGPVDGFTMRFQVERKPLSTLDRNRYGFGAYRIGVSHWEVIPEPSLTDESAEEALRRGSRFAMAVRTAPENATLTFWVYPDSFHAFRILQAACQAEGFVVAARPLPVGLGIMGSPDGSRSAGQ